MTAQQAVNYGTEQDYLDWLEARRPTSPDVVGARIAAVLAPARARGERPREEPIQPIPEFLRRPSPIDLEAETRKARAELLAAAEPRAFRDKVGVDLILGAIAAIAIGGAAALVGASLTIDALVAHGMWPAPVFGVE